MAQFELVETGYPLTVQADSLEPAPGGWLLAGDDVAVSVPFQARRFYRHGFHSWSQAGWLDLQAQHQAPVLRHLWPQQDDPFLLASYPTASSGVAALQAPDGHILLLGALQVDARVVWSVPDLKGVCQPLDEPDQAAGPAVRRWFLALAPELEAFDSYAQILSKVYGSAPAAPAPAVWCSWYSLFRDISEPALFHILEGLEGLPFDVFQVDDGWQQQIGHWLPNTRFPNGMPALTDRIRAAGLKPGLWLAPFIAEPSAPVFQQHPAWFIHDHDGSPQPAGENWGGPYYALDVTHPDAQQWLMGVIRRTRLWGYDYLKLDFLFAASLPGERFRPMPGEAAYRLGMQIVRQAAGPNTYILACGAPVLATLGLAQGLRIGPDTAPFWDNPDRTLYLHDPTGPAASNALRTSLARIWLRPLLHIDPDVVFFRTRYNLLNPSQKEAQRCLAKVCGFYATSDLPGWLDPSERQELYAFLNTRSTCQRLSPTRFRLDGNEYDFSAILPEAA